MTNLAPYNPYHAKTLGPQWDTGYYLMRVTTQVGLSQVDGWSEFCMIEELVNKHFVWFNAFGDRCETDWEIIGAIDLLTYCEDERFVDWIKGHAP